MIKRTRPIMRVSERIVVIIAVSIIFAGVVWAPAGERRYPGGTFSGPILLPDGTSGAPTVAFASEVGTGWFLSKALRLAGAIDGTGTILTLDTTTGLVVDVDVTLGNASGDAVTFHGGTWNILNLLTANFSGDYVLEVGANTMTINAVTGALEVNAPSVFDGTFEIKGINGMEFSPGPGVDATFLAPQIVGSPTLGWVDASKSWAFVSPLIVPDATIAAHALNQKVGDVRYIMATTQDSIEVLFGGNTFSNFSTSNTTYTTAGIFRFGGTTARGTPTSVKFIGFKDASPTSWDVRVFDLTNSLVIAEVTGSTGVAAELVTDGTLTNLPTGEAMWEVQVKRDGGTGGSEAHVHAVSVLF